jgi:hypothetical protein
MKYKIRLPEDIREARDRARPCPAAKKYFMASSNRPSYVIGGKDTSGLSAIERLRAVVASLVAIRENHEGQKTR